MIAPLAPSAATADTAALVLVEHALPGAVLGIDADAEGAWVLNHSGILRVALDGTPTTALELGNGGLLRELQALDDGSFLLTNVTTGSVRKVGADGHEPVLRLQGVQFDLGPDGALYAHTHNRSQSTVVRLEPGTRDETVVAVLHESSVYDLAFAPSGELFAAYGGYVSRFEEATGAFVPVYSTGYAPSAIAFDAAGRLYVAHGVWDSARRYSTSLVRVDLETGEATMLLNLGRDMVHGLAFGGTRLYAANLAWNGPTGNRTNLVHVDLGVPGFEGFPGSLPLPPAGDLAITHVDVERGPPLELPGLHPGPLPPSMRRNDVNEVRTIVVTVTNVGPGPVEGRWHGTVDMKPDSLGATASNLAEFQRGRLHPFGFEGALESGESRTFRMPWDVSRLAGQFKVDVSVDHWYPNDVLELDEVDNNRAETVTVVRTTL